MSTPARGSSSSGRGTGHHNHGTQHTVTQTPYQTQGTTQGAQREKGSQQQSWQIQTNTNPSMFSLNIKTNPVCTVRNI